MAVQHACPEAGDDADPVSPKTKLKFLCSHGGEILPRPIDGFLKYVGGDTRIVAVPRGIDFSDLMKKLNALFNGDMILKYQLIPDDLDILVTVKSDEDLKHMLVEYDRYRTISSPKFRAFLFNSRPTTHSRSTGQTYIDPVNGGAGRSPANSTVSHPTFSISSPGSSPELHPNFANRHEPALPSTALANRRNSLHKVRSSPALCSLNNVSSQGDGGFCCNNQIQKQRHRCYNGYHSPAIVRRT